jgi:Kef-type K+ transport system membrane component KefB
VGCIAIITYNTSNKNKINFKNRIMKTVIGVITILIVFPIRVYLIWYLLNAVNATELPMFIFWVSVPFVLLMAILSEIAKKQV